MNSRSSHTRRRFLTAAGVSVGSTLAGCSGSAISENIEQLDDGELSQRELEVLRHLPRLESSEYSGDALTVRTFSPTKITNLAHSRGYLQRLDRAIPLELNVDVGALVNAAVGLDGAFVSLTGSSSESIENVVADLGDSTGTIGSYTVYSRSETVFAVDEATVLFAQPDDQLSISPEELVERVIEAEARAAALSASTASETQTDTLSERETLAKETLSQVGTDHILSIALPFGQTVFGSDTSFTSGTRAVAWGLTAKGGPTVVTEFVAEFPDGDASTTPVVKSLPDDVQVGEKTTTEWGSENEGGSFVVDAVAESEYVHVDRETVAIDGNTVTASSEHEAKQFDTRNPYLRIRGHSDALVVRVRGSQYEWSFDYPAFGVTDVAKPVVPADRPIILELTSDELFHKISIPDIEMNGLAAPQIVRYRKVSVSDPGRYELYCSNYCGAGHSKMQTVVSFVDASEFEDWVSSK